MKKLFLAIFALLVLAVAAPLLFRSSGGERAARPVEGLPWQIEVLPGGASRVFGLTLGSSTLEEAQARLGADMQLAIVAAPGEAGAVEAYYDNATLGVVTGKVILTAELARESVEAMRARAPESRYMESSTRRFSLHPDDRASARRAPIAAIAVIPSANLDEQTILQRFGPPAERIRASAHAEHFLYPEKGLDIVLDSEGKELLQYVAPRQFAHLREPLATAKDGPARATDGAARR